MRLILITIFSVLLSFPTFAQSEEEIIEEAFLLYNSERASWAGTDILVAQFSDLRPLVGGYFSYSKGNTHNCLFFDKSPNPNLLIMFSFDDNFDFNTIKIDTVKRVLNAHELDLFTIRQKALKELQTNDMFQFYKNTNPNLIPIISGKKKQVFILTGPQSNDVVIFGNDYLLTFDKNNKLKKSKVLHNNLISLKIDNSLTDVIAMHTHLKSTGDLITSTDICTIMLYEKFAGWDQYIVISEKKVSLWDCKTDKLAVIKREVWDKIYEHEK